MSSADDKNKQMQDYFITNWGINITTSNSLPSISDPFKEMQERIDYLEAYNRLVMIENISLAKKYNLLEERIRNLEGKNDQRNT